MDPIRFPGDWKVNRAGETVTQTRPQEAAQAVESFFLSYLLKVMRESSPDGGLLGETGASHQMLQGVWDEALARAMVARGGIGLRSWILEALEATPGEPDQGGGEESR